MQHIVLISAFLGFGEKCGQNPLPSGLQLDANGQTALQLRNQIGRLGDVKGPRGDEENVVGANQRRSACSPWCLR